MAKSGSKKGGGKKRQIRFSVPFVSWGLVLLVGLWISDYASQIFPAGYVWAAWGIILPLGNFAVGKTMRGAPREVNVLWKQTNVLIFLLTLGVALVVAPANTTVVVSLWLLLMGAALFAGCMYIKNPSDMMLGAFYLIASLMVPAFFSPFIGAAVLLGLPLVIRGLFA